MIAFHFRIHSLPDPFSLLLSFQKPSVSHKSLIETFA